MCCVLPAVPKEYIPGVLKGLEESMTSGQLAGFPVVDVTTTLYDGSYHEVDSSALAFQIAARGAFRWVSMITDTHSSRTGIAYALWYLCLYAIGMLSRPKLR